VTALEALRQQVARPEKFEVHHVDLRNLDQIDDAVNHVERAYGTVDILLNFAGVWHDDNRAFCGTQLTEISPEEISDVIGIGLQGALFLTRRVLRSMKEKQMGKVVFVSCGFSSPQEAGGWVHYYVVNKAIEALTRGIAAECRPDNIQINCIAPWFVATEAVRRFFPDKLGTALQPGEVARAALLLVSDQSDNVSGQVIELRSSKDY
jgi:3-oxoacyl-[acyl-carrier protein] reductase